MTVAGSHLAKWAQGQNLSQRTSEVGQRSCFQGLHRRVRLPLSKLGFASCTKSILTNSASLETAVTDRQLCREAHRRMPQKSTSDWLPLGAAYKISVYKKAQSVSQIKERFGNRNCLTHLWIQTHHPCTHNTNQLMKVSKVIIKHGLGR